MAHSNYITISLKLQELSVLNVRDIGEKIEIEVIRKWDYAVCPSCGLTTSRIHQRNTPFLLANGLKENRGSTNPGQESDSYGS